MNLSAWSCEQCRQVDRRAWEEYGLSGLVLMENAGRGVADFVLRRAWPDPIVVCCGKGNNAGDGFVVARHLEAAGRKVQVLSWSTLTELHGDARVNADICQKMAGNGLSLTWLGSQPPGEEHHRQLRSAGIILDCLLGTGSRGAPRAPLDAAIRAINASGRPVVAVDLPSGLDADTGQAAEPTVVAQFTCTFVALKRGFLQPGADQHTGQVGVLEIGIPRQLMVSVTNSCTLDA